MITQNTMILVAAVVAIGMVLKSTREGYIITLDPRERTGFPDRDGMITLDPRERTGFPDRDGMITLDPRERTGFPDRDGMITLDPRELGGFRPGERTRIHVDPMYIPPIAIDPGFRPLPIKLKPGKSIKFPQLLGMDKTRAYKYIKKQYPMLSPHLIREGSAYMTRDYNNLRLRIIYSGKTNRVAQIPKTG